MASHIKLESTLSLSPETLILTSRNTSDSGSDSGLVTSSKSIEAEKTFNQELQWRILNLLAQQLFQNNHETLTNDLFTNNWLYTTQTFSVNISALNPDFFLIKIIDAQLGSETKLEIPRL